MIEELGYPKWIANWGSNDGTCQGDLSADGVLHQYTSTPIDKDVAYHDLDFYKSSPTEEKPTDDQEPNEDDNVEDKPNDKPTEGGVDYGLINKILKWILKLLKKIVNIFK